MLRGRCGSGSNLDVGRPEKVALIFGRRINRRTPGTFHTRVITQDVDPQMSCYYKSSRIKQYFKERRALRTETVVCDTRDFGIGRRVTADNWKALRAVGDSANQRLCDAQAADARPAPDVATFTEVTRPSTIDGQHAPALRFGEPRVMAVMAPIVGFTHLLAGFDNPALVQLVGALLDQPYTSRQATYDLRRLKRKGLIVRLPDITATNSPHWADELRCCSPRPTDESWPQAWQRSTHTCLPNSLDVARSPSHGGNSTAPLTTSLARPSPRLKPQLGLTVKSALTKQS